MHFKRLRLSGFKSFVEPTELWIERGLTGIVGPNGCGKSNLLEALRWVMGESSPKSMRGGGMEDVIFAGTAARPARNLADVTLLIDNSARRAPAAFNDMDEVEISRRIERDIGSSYRVNGKDVRQKDVQLLFADAATGAHSPALVSQGRIGNLITAKPVQRRQLLEEAAGISGLHARRKEAESRLRSAEANLARLADLMGQMEGQIAALKRQARQAERYRALSGEVRGVEAMLLYSRWKAETERLEAAEAALKRAEGEVAALTAQSAAISRTQADIAARLPDLRKAEAEAGAALHRLNVARETLDQEEARLAHAQGELSQRRAQIEADLAREGDIAADAEAALARLAEENTQLATQLAANEEALKAASVKVREEEAAASAAEEAFDRMNREVANAQARRETAEGAVRAALRRIERLEAERERLARERQRLLAEDDAGRAVAAAEERLVACETALSEAARILDERQATLVKAEEAREGARKTLSEAESQARHLAAEIAALEAVLSAQAPSGDAKPVAERICCTPGYETALGAALGDDLLIPLDAGPRHWAAMAPLVGAPPLPQGVESLAAHVEAPPALSRRLTQIGVVGEADGARLAAQLRPGQRLVSREGALWRWDGLVASAEAPSGASIRLAQRNRLAELSARHAPAAQSEAAARAAFEAARTAAEAARQEASQARHAEAAASQALGEARRSAARLAQAASERLTRLSGLDAGLARLDSERQAAVTEKAEAEAALGALPALDGLGEQLQEARNAASAQRAALGEARATLDRLQRERTYRRDRQDAVMRERAAWSARSERAGEQRQTLAQRQAEIEEAINALANRPAEIAAQRTALMDQIGHAEARRRQEADRLAVVENQLAEVDKQARLAQEALTQARERRVRHDAEMEAHGERRRDIAHDIGQKFQCPPPLVLAAVGIEDDHDLPALDALEARLERLKAERERLGAVNLRADIELQDVTQQLQHLTGEKADLETAIARLRAGIGALNREGRERLLHAFNAVNGHFSELFKTLFGGGQAHLELIESDDPLEAGLEIMASPPGKRLQTLSLLSGGEQALTALSLIFAVFMTNPAPICVLDEVDAPLDDANVERFCNLLDEMTRLTETRFLIVTHNAVTMARMDRLFGVTMAERGVSQLVSVDLASAGELRAAE
ncbi:MAG: chromosome segregation SMC family protein [Pseudomonadota bacterium]